MPRPRMWAYLIVLLSTTPASHAQIDDLSQDPWNTDPALMALADRITFQVTYEGDTMTPVMAAGEWEPIISGVPIFADGPFGRCLQAGGGSAIATYPRGANASLASMGAVSLWICPVEWTRVNGGNTVFAKCTASRFYIQRQGPAHDETGKLTRHENLQFLMLGDVTGNKNLSSSTKKWSLGKWRLIVANWNLPTMSVSIDGGEFKTTTVKEVPEDDYFGDLMVGGVNGEVTLLDEVTFYRRPLSLEEVRHLYETFKPADPEVEQ